MPIQRSMVALHHVYIDGNILHRHQHFKNDSVNGYYIFVWIRWLEEGYFGVCGIAVLGVNFLRYCGNDGKNLRYCGIEL